MSVQVKKAFQPMIEFLEANANKKVATILPELIEMVAKAKAGGSGTGRNFVKDDDGNVIAVFCYYHKKWELVEHVPYGKKASNKATGLNTMCKEGVSNWTKQQRQYQKAKDEVLNRVMAGELTYDDVADELAKHDEELKSIKPLSEQYGSYTSDSLDELMS